MNSDVPMRLHDVATALPPVELRTTWQSRTGILFPTAITCGVAAGVLALPSLIYGTYRLCVARNWDDVLIPLFSGMFLHTVLSAGVGRLVDFSVWRLGNRLLVNRTRDLETQVEQWSTQNHTAVNENHLRTLTLLATPVQLGRLMKFMSLDQQLLLRQLVGARTFESSVVPASDDSVRPYWTALHALSKPTTDLTALLANEQFRLMFRKRPKFAPAVGIMIAQARNLTPELEVQLREFSVGVRAKREYLPTLLRHITLAHYDPRAERADFSRLSVGDDTYYGHPSIVHNVLPDLTPEQAAVFDLYLRLLHSPVPEPTAIERLSPVQRLAMRNLIERLGSFSWIANGAITLLAGHIDVWYREQLAEITPDSLRRCWESASLPGNEWKKPLILSTLERGSTAGFTVDLIFELWDPNETPEPMSDWVRQQRGSTPSREVL